VTTEGGLSRRSGGSARRACWRTRIDRHTSSRELFDNELNFVPDGTPVPVTSSPRCGVGDSIAPDQTCEFSFDLPANTKNWAFETFADSGGLPIFNLVATTIPGPPSVVLLGLGLLGLLIDWRKMARRA
jgi:hypothetical protein